MPSPAIGEAKPCGGAPEYGIGVAKTLNESIKVIAMTQKFENWKLVKKDSKGDNIGCCDDSIILPPSSPLSTLVKQKKHYSQHCNAFLITIKLTTTK